MRRKKCAALIGAAITVASLGTAGIQHASAADTSGGIIKLGDVWSTEVYAVHTLRGAIIKNVQIRDVVNPGRNDPAGDKWMALFVDHQNRSKAGKCSSGSTTAWSTSLGTVGVPALSPWGPGGAPTFTQLNFLTCETQPGGPKRAAQVQINTVGEICFERLSPSPGWYGSCNRWMN